MQTTVLFISSPLSKAFQSLRDSGSFCVDLHFVLHALANAQFIRLVIVPTLLWTIPEPLQARIFSRLRENGINATSVGDSVKLQDPNEIMKGEQASLFLSIDSGCVSLKLTQVCRLPRPGIDPTIATTYFLHEEAGSINAQQTLLGLLDEFILDFVAENPAEKKK